MSSHSDREKEKSKRETHEPEVVFSSEPEPVLEESDPAAVGAQFAEAHKQLLAEKKELMETLLRRQADFENYRKRVEKEKHHERHRGVSSLIEHLLPVLDAFDRALAFEDASSADYRKGFELIRRQLWDVLAKQGLVRIESVGKQFDPNFHHAIERVETPEHEEGTVIGEMQPGYMFHDRVLRPAMVRVASPAHPAHASKHGEK